MEKSNKSVCCYAESVYLTVNVFFYPDIYCPWFTIVFCVAPMHSLTTKYKSLLINKVLNGFHKREKRKKGPCFVTKMLVKHAIGFTQFTYYIQQRKLKSHNKWKDCMWYFHVYDKWLWARPVMWTLINMKAVVELMEFAIIKFILCNVNRFLSK